MPAGYREVGSIGTKPEDETPKFPDGDSMTTDRDWPGVIHIAKCQGGKCQRRIVARETFDLNDPDLRASERERFHPARIGDSILAVWRAGTRGGLRLRVAPIDRLAATSDTVLFDDLVQEGVMHEGGIPDPPTLEFFRVYGGTREALVFLGTSRGTWIVVVDESGAFHLRGSQAEVRRAPAESPAARRHLPARGASACPREPSSARQPS